MCSVRCLMFSLTTLAVIWLTTGALSLGVGLYAHIVSGGGTETGDGSNSRGLFDVQPAVFILIGCLLVILGLLGSWASTCRSRLCHYAFVSLLLLLILAEGALGGYMFWMEPNREVFLKRHITKEFEQALFGGGASLYAVQAVVERQKKDSCCGLDGYEFWTRHLKSVPKEIDKSCCPDPGTARSCLSREPGRHGCLQRGISLLKREVYTEVIILIVLIATEILAVVLSLCLARLLKPRVAVTYQQPTLPRGDCPCPREPSVVKAESFCNMEKV